MKYSNKVTKSPWSNLCLHYSFSKFFIHSGHPGYQTLPHFSLTLLGHATDRLGIYHRTFVFVLNYQVRATPMILSQGLFSPQIFLPLVSVYICSWFLTLRRPHQVLKGHFSSKERLQLSYMQWVIIHLEELPEWSLFSGVTVVFIAINEE